MAVVVCMSENNERFGKPWPGDEYGPEFGCGPNLVIFMSHSL
jgi:hypothetical protein